MSSLSVILSNYNHARYVGGALDAILAESRPADEIILIDDGSTDGSPEILLDYARRHPVIRFFQNERNTGAIAAANKALALATGEVIYPAAADDRVLPGLFESAMGMLERYPRAGLCTSDPATFDHTGIVCVDELRWRAEPSYLSPEDLADALDGGFISGHATLARRVAMTEFGGFRPDLRWACDWFLWLGIGFTYGVCYVPRPLAAFRRSSSSFSGAGERDREQHEQVLGRLLTLVRSPAYRRLLPLFVRSGAFAHHGESLVRLILGSEEHWNVETLLLALRPLHQSSGARSSAAARQARLERRLDRLVPWVIEQCRRDGIGRVVLYGAGSHTRLVVPRWQTHGGPLLAGLISADPVAANGLESLPVLSPDEYTPRHGDGIVLSSNSFELAMAESCRSRWPATPYYMLYHPKPGSEPAPEPLLDTLDLMPEQK